MPHQRLAARREMHAALRPLEQGKSQLVFSLPIRRLIVEVSRPSDFAARPKLPAWAAAARYLRSTMSIITALPGPEIQPLGACHLQNFWLEQLGNGERISLDLCQTCDDPFVWSPGSVSCSARVPAIPRGWPPTRTAPGAGATHSPSGIVAGRRRPVLGIGMEGFSVKKRAIGRPDTLRALFKQGHADCVVKGRQVGDGLSRISDAGKFLLPGVACGIIAHLRCGIIRWRFTWSGRR